MRTQASILGLLLLSACASTPREPVPEGPSMNARRYAKLKQLASKELSCDGDKLQHAYQGDNLHQMAGCGDEVVYELRCMMGSCAWIQDVRIRAAFDLSCERSKLKVFPVGKDTRGASGCGRKATYLLNPMSGDWILNSPVVGFEDGAASKTENDKPVGI